MVKFELRMALICISNMSRKYHSQRSTSDSRDIGAVTHFCTATMRASFILKQQKKYVCNYNVLEVYKLHLVAVFLSRQYSQDHSQECRTMFPKFCSCITSIGILGMYMKIYRKCLFLGLPLLLIWNLWRWGLGICSLSNLGDKQVAKPKLFVE